MYFLQFLQKKEMIVIYPYHNKIKQRIYNGELTGFRFVENYKNTGERLLLFFETQPFVRPVRPHKYAEYIEILSEYENNFNKQIDSK